MSQKRIFPNYERNTKIISKKASLDSYAQTCLMIIWIHKKTIKDAIKKIDPDAKITFRYTFLFIHEYLFKIGHSNICT